MNSDAHDTPARDGSPATEASGGVPIGLPASSTVCSKRLPTGEILEFLVVPVEASASGIDAVAAIVGTMREWVSVVPSAQPPVVVPLYDCHVVWTPGRAAVAGPPDRVATLERAAVDFARQEAELRDAERRSVALMDAIDIDTAGVAEIDAISREQRTTLTTRYRVAVALSRGLSLVAPAMRAPPVHPPTLASQLGERLRDRTRLVERHELVTDRAEFVERVAEFWAGRAVELGVAKQQTGLEWAIVVLLVVQTALLVVDLLAQRGSL